KPILIRAFQGLQPALERLFLAAIGEKSDSLGDFTDGKNADEQMIGVERFHGVTHASVTFWTAQFGEHASIEQDPHNATSLMEERSRSGSSPSSEGPLPSRNSLKLWR